jgi:hypothetical protein
MSRPIAELLDRCRAAGSSLLIEEDKLHLDFERYPPAGLVDGIRSQKSKVMAALSGAVLSNICYALFVWDRRCMLASSGGCWMGWFEWQVSVRNQSVIGPKGPR